MSRGGILSAPCPMSHVTPYPTSHSQSSALHRLAGAQRHKATYTKGNIRGSPHHQKSAMSTPFTRALRYCSALCLAALALPASANCAITHNTSSTAVQKVFKETDGYHFQNYDVVCNKLRKANARIIVSGSYGVLSNRSYGWASIAVADKASDHLIVNDFGSDSTWMNDYASDDKAREMLWAAINDALGKWDSLDQALASLNKARRTAPARKAAAQ